MRVSDAPQKFRSILENFSLGPPLKLGPPRIFPPAPTPYYLLALPSSWNSGSTKIWHVTCDIIP